VKTSSILVAALASGLLFLPLAQGAAAPSGAGALKSLSPAVSGTLVLVKGGGGGGGGGFGHGGGGGGYGHGGGGGVAHFSGMAHGSGRYSGGRVQGFAYSSPSHVYAGRTYAGRNVHHGARSYAWNHDNWNGHHRRYRRFYGPYIYGGGYGYYDDYGYDDCYWLRRQAIITGSPYWWRRYYACAG
jgi:hypothetical protein